MSEALSLATVWSRTLDYIRALVPAHHFKSWFERIRLASLDDAVAVIDTPNPFFRDWLERNYRALMEEALVEAVGAPRKVTLAINESLQPEPMEPAEQDAAKAAADQARAQAERRPKSAPPVEAHRPYLTAGYTFENFIVGPSNQMAYASCKSVVEHPAEQYNPLFLHGGVGLGKTHLLQAICHDALRRAPKTRIAYLSCESFTNEYIEAIQNGRIHEFRKRYRDVDLLLVDDIHFLTAKEATQEEFFNTFNALHGTKRQIILSSDAAPQEIPELEERLVSRFCWGLVAPLERPHYETRAAIIRQKALDRRRELPPDVVDFLAQTLDSNIREIEGAILKLVVTANLEKREIDLPFCRASLRERVQLKGPLPISEIMSRVAAHYHVKVSELQGPKRHRNVTLARQICMYLGRHLAKLSLQELGGHFGGRDHTTVMHSVQKIEDIMRGSDPTRGVVEQLMKELER